MVDQKPSIVIVDSERDGQTMGYFRSINALVLGAEVKFDQYYHRSEAVTQRTILIARQLGIPEHVIRKWRGERERLVSRRARQIKPLLNKLSRSALAQLAVEQ